MEINVVEGALDADARQELIARFTQAVGQHAGIPLEERVPVYLVMRDVPLQSWGIFGKPITLGSLHNPPADAKPVWARDFRSTPALHVVRYRTLTGRAIRGLAEWRRSTLG